MIAPLRNFDSGKVATTSSPELPKARRLAARMLFAGRTAAPRPSPVPAWQAWLLTAWIVGAGTVYALIMAGLWSE
jgi:hypothetical protein